MHFIFPHNNDGHSEDIKTTEEFTEYSYSKIIKNIYMYIEFVFSKKLINLINQRFWMKGFKNTSI